MIEDKIDSFASMFAGVGFAESGERVKKRADQEKRQNLSDKQRARAAIRTAQLNFRCSPAFKDRMAKITRERGVSMADLFEEWIDKYERGQ